MIAPGIVAGGIPYDQWVADPKSIELPGSEMRERTCPAWWYQSVDYNKMPTWKECVPLGAFSSCPSYSTKQKCWQRWDREQVVGEGT